MGANVCGHHQPATIHLLPQSPDVDGQRGQVTTGRDQRVCQQDRTAEVQGNKATSPLGKKKYLQYTVEIPTQNSKGFIGTCIRSEPHCQGPECATRQLY